MITLQSLVVWAEEALPTKKVQSIPLLQLVQLTSLREVAYSHP